MMMKIFLQLLVLIGAILFLSCEPEEESLAGAGNYQLTISTDTVLFDTLLTIRTSITKRFRIHNPNSKAINISEIRLGKGSDSPYSMIANGKTGTSIQDEVLFGGDSLLVLVNVSIDPEDADLPYLVKDSIIVEWNNYERDVKLVAWGQDAHFINSEIVCDEVWTADRPYVIYNSILVDTLCTLTVEPGTRIYLDNSASFYVIGTLKIMGDSSKHVTVRNTRFDANYVQAPGQWDAIYFLQGSKENEIHFADIENGSVGLRVGSPDDDTDFDVVVANTTIRHMSVAGILAFTSDVYAYNTEIYNAGTYLVGNFAGGNYRYTHCTFSNTPSSFISNDAMVQFSDNVIISDSELLVGDLSVEMTNCILWGDGDDQFLLSDAGGGRVDTSLVSNIIKSTFEIPGNYVSTNRNFPGFYDPFAFDFTLDSLAFARDKGVVTEIKEDLTGRLRDSKPDIGAFERIDK